MGFKLPERKEKDTFDPHGDLISPINELPPDFTSKKTILSFGDIEKAVKQTQKVRFEKRRIQVLLEKLGERELQSRPRLNHEAGLFHSKRFKSLSTTSNRIIEVDHEESETIKK